MKRFLVDRYLRLRAMIQNGLPVGNEVRTKLRQFSQSPRYTKGTFNLKEKTISFPDARSFAFTYDELFNKGIYTFQSENTSPYIIDCGANIGLSVIFFKQLFPACRILAFEPEKNIFRYLSDNVAALELKDVELVQKALWKEEAVLSFSDEGSDANRITALNESEGGFRSVYDVQAVRLSNYLNQQVDFLKIDIEGAEVEVVKEIESKLPLVKNIFIEYHSFESGRQQLDEILAILTRNGFHYYIDAPNPSATMPFVKKDTFLAFDFFLNIYATNERFGQ